MTIESIIEYDTVTGIAHERAMTAEESAQMDSDRDADRAAAQAQADKQAADAAARAAAIAHAKSLGFTDAMIAVMYPTLVEA